MSCSPSPAIRVGIVCHFPPPPGGMPAQAEALATGLARERYQVRRIRTNLGGGRLGRWLDQRRFVRTVCRIPVFLGRLMACVARVDLLHVLAGSGLSFFIFTAPAVLAGAALGRRVVLHYHGGEARAFFRRWPRFVRFISRRADRIIVPSPFVQEAFASLAVNAEVVPNICDTDRFAYTARPYGSPVLLIARHLEPIYNVGCAIRAFTIVRRRCPTARLIIAGGGSEARRLKELAAVLDVSDAIEFTGYVPHDAMSSLYRAATVFVNSSNVDNFPIAILEAFSSGLPVVTTAAGGIPSLVDHGVNGLLVRVGDAQELADAIVRLIDDPALAERLRCRARHDVRRYAWAQVYPRLSRIYDLNTLRSGSLSPAGRHRSDAASRIVRPLEERSHL